MQIKLCPECGAEYFASITECADCEVVLMTLEQIKHAGLVETSLSDASASEVIIREGEKEWIQELHHVLLDSGISCRISLPDCTAEACGTTHHLLASEEDAAAATVRIENYYREIHPEISASETLAAEGKCPACGHHAGHDAKECPDCGLILLVEEE
jgi:uncharacterized OB-fold protein